MYKCYSPSPFFFAGPEAAAMPPAGNCYLCGTLMKIRIPLLFYPLAAMLFWGFSFIWSDRLLETYQPVTIIFARLVVSSAFLFLLMRLLREKMAIERADLGLILLSAVFNPFLYFLGENYGLKHSSPTIAAVIIATIPVFSPLIGYMTFREKLSPLNFLGIGVSFIGVLMILIRKDLSPAADLKGILFLFGAVFSALFYSAVLRKLTRKYSALVLVAYQNLIGIVLFLPVFLFLEAPAAMTIPVTGSAVMYLLFLAILASSLAFVFFAHSVKHLGISKSNVFSNLIPVFTAVFSYWLLGEQFSANKIAGIALVIGGVYLSERTKKRG